MSRTDPSPPIDGTCAECGRKRGQLAKTPKARAAAVLDPFCSTECARAWHGVVYATLGGERGLPMVEPRRTRRSGA